MQSEHLIQPIDTTHDSVKIGGELVRAQAMKSKGAYDERVNGDVNISRDIIGSSKASQGCL